MDSEIIGALIAASATIIGALIANTVGSKAKKVKNGGPQRPQWLWAVGGAAIGGGLVLGILLLTGNLQFPIASITTKADPALYDDFNDPAFDGKWNAELWTNSDDTPVKQEGGVLVISRQSGRGGLDVSRPRAWTIDQIGFIEAELKLDSDIEASEWGDVYVGTTGLLDESQWWAVCYILGKQGGQGSATAGCNASNYEGNSISVPYDSWHTVRLEINPDTAVMSFFIDGQQIDSFVPAEPEVLGNAAFNVFVGVWSLGGGLVTGYVDDVRIGRLDQ